MQHLYIISKNTLVSTGNMAQSPPHERTLREMATPDFTYESLCIQYPDKDVPYVLKTGLIHLLPKFHGLAGEDPLKNLKEFHIFCSTMKPPNGPRVKFLLLWVIYSHLRRTTPNAHMFQTQFPTFKQLKSVFGTALVET